MTTDVPGHERPSKRSTPDDVWLILGPPLVTLLLFTVYFLKDLPRYESAVLPPLLFVLGFVTALFAQAAAFAVLIGLAFVLRRRTGRIGLVPLLLVTPLLGFLALFGYDYFLHSSIPAGRDDRPAFTRERFFVAWGFEALVVLGYWLLLKLVGNPARPAS